MLKTLTEYSLLVGILVGEYSRSAARYGGGDGANSKEMGAIRGGVGCGIHTFQVSYHRGKQLRIADVV